MINFQLRRRTVSSFDSFLGRSKPAYTPLPIVASHSLNLALCLQCLLLRPPTRTTFLRTILAPQLLLLPPPQIAAFRRPQISPPSSLVVDVNTADNWKMWRQTWENYCVIADLGTQPEDYKCALLLHSIGTDALRIYNGFKFTEGEDRNKMADIITKFEQHFLGQTQEFFERFQFNRRNQEPGETIDQYVSTLRNMSKTCGFCDCMKDKLIMDCILLGVTEDKNVGSTHFNACSNAEQGDQKLSSKGSHIKANESHKK